MGKGFPSPAAGFLREVHMQPTSKANTRQEKDAPKERKGSKEIWQSTNGTHSKRDFILFTNTSSFVQNIDLNKGLFLFLYNRSPQNFFSKNYKSTNLKKQQFSFREVSKNSQKGKQFSSFKFSQTKVKVPNILRT